MQLSEFDAQAFLTDYWQKKPVVMRSAWPDWVNPIDPDSLAGLACEEEAESRLVLHGASEWTVDHGPLPESRFADLPADHWSLLVQAVDHYVPEVAALIAPFRFVPNWRIDDVMVSLAADGGGVGPHYDQYDVFLIQGLGARRWQIGAHCNENSALLPHDDLRLLAEFRCEQDWVLEPGDILYVPPGLAHNGIAVGNNCMTYSVGFRAPSRHELATYWTDEPLSGRDDRYSDPNLAIQENPGEISPEAIDRLHRLLGEELAERNEFASWFGEYCTRPKYPEIDWSPEKELSTAVVRQAIGNKVALRRNPASRFAFVRTSGGSVLLCVDGASFECAKEQAIVAEHICAADLLTVDASFANQDDTVALIADLINRGCLAFDSD